MKLSELVDRLGLKVFSGQEYLDRRVKGGYTSDMLSDVIAHAGKDNIWITLQTHLNIVPVAMMKEVAAILIVNGRKPDEETLTRAEEEQIPILGTELNAYETSARLSKLGL